MREKKEINIQIGEQVKLAREEIRLTQEQLAERIDVSPQYISDLERGVVGLSVPTLKRLCAALCTSSDRILFGTRTGNRENAVAEMCRGLTNEQFRVITEVIEKFLEVIYMDQKKPPLG